MQFTALCNSLIRVVIINDCVIKHPDTKRATRFMLIRAVNKDVYVGETRPPTQAAQDRIQPPIYIYGGHSSGDSNAHVLARE